MHRRFRQVLTSLREHSCVSYAKVATAGGFCDIDHIIVKATAPDDLPLPERYVHQLLKIFLISPSSFRAFSLSFTRRFGKTRCWRVALKCLLLLHRLLRSVPQNSLFRSELLWIRSNGFISLHPCHFRDTSSSASQDYTLFIQSYAQLLDEALDCFALDGLTTDNQQDTGKPIMMSKPYFHPEVPESLSEKMKEVGRLIHMLPQLQSLIDRVMDCQPTGPAARNFIVSSAMKHIVRDSFICYSIFRKEIVVLLECLIQMPYRNCILAFGIYKKAAVQANQLSEFYEMCKAAGFCGSYEYPFIDRIPHLQIEALETFLNGMWQLTDQSSSSTTTPSTEDDDHFGPLMAPTDIFVTFQWERFDMEQASPKELEGDEEEPLIQLEANDNLNWETLLEASINLSPLPGGDRHEALMDGWKMQVYNPFHQPHNYLPDGN